MLVRAGRALVGRTVSPIQALANLLGGVDHHGAVGNALGKLVQSPLGFGRVSDDLLQVDSVVLGHCMRHVGIISRSNRSTGGAQQAAGGTKKCSPFVSHVADMARHQPSIGGTDTAAFEFKTAAGDTRRHPPNHGRAPFQGGNRGSTPRAGSADLISNPYV
jgi:hypothetical protein